MGAATGPAPGATRRGWAEAPQKNAVSFRPIPFASLRVPSSDAAGARMLRADARRLRPGAPPVALPRLPQPVRGKLAQLAGVEVRYGPELHGTGPTVDHVEPLSHYRRVLPAGTGRPGRPGEQVDPVRPALVHQRGDRAIVEVFGAPTQHREAIGREIGHRRREIELAGEPRLHDVVVGRHHVDQVVDL